MVVLSVSFHVQPAHVEAFIPEILANARGSRTEPGNLRYDVLQDNDDPTHFVLYEVYRDEAAVQAHRNSDHFKTWVARAGGWLIEPRTRVVSTPLFFGDAELGTQ